MRKIATTIGLLTISNLFMNLAWYGPLKFKGAAIWLTILVSWGIALVEYCFQVPANRIGNEVLTLTQLKVTQEVISLSTFVIVALVLFKEKPTWNHAAAFGCICLGAYFATRK